MASQGRTIRTRLRAAGVPVLIFLCLLLGGSSRSIVGPFFLQVLAILLIAWTLLAPKRAELSPAARPLVIFAVLMIALVFLQLIPLPPAVWSALPGRAGIASGFDRLEEPRPWLPLSLTPQDTVAAFPTLLPPLAIAAGILLLGAYRRYWLVAALVGGTLLGVLLGAMQVVSGGEPAEPLDGDGRLPWASSPRIIIGQRSCWPLCRS